MRKYLLLTVALIVSTSTFAQELPNYIAIKSALAEGKDVRIVTDFTQCHTTYKTKALKTMSVGIFTPNEIGFTDEHIATSFTHFTLNDPYFPNKPVLEFVRYTITPDENMKASLQILDPKTYKILKDDLAFDCKINEATKVFIK